MDTNYFFLDDDLFDFGESSIYTDSLHSPSSSGSDVENHIIYDPTNGCGSLQPFAAHGTNITPLPHGSPPRQPGAKGTGKKVYQRKAANMRERRRMKSINDAFETLRTCIPSDVHSERRMSKVDTLRLAMRYIGFLSDLVQSCSDVHSQGGHQNGRLQEKVIVRCHLNDEDGLYGHEGVLYGHSLSWEDPHNRQHGPNHGSKLVAKIWMPENATESDLINLASYCTDC